MYRTLSKAAALCAAAGVSAGLWAQDINWNNAAGGDWNTPGNWDPMEVPNAGTEVAVVALPGAYDVLIRSISPNLAGLFITNPSAVVGLGNGLDLFLRGSTATIDGVLVINDQGSTSATRLLINDPMMTLGGSGQIVLNDSSSAAIGRAQLIDLVGGQVTTIGPDLIVRGSGQITAALINNGTIRADADGLMLNIITGAKTNNGTIEVDNNGLLRLGVPITQGASGQIS